MAQASEQEAQRFEVLWHPLAEAERAGIPDATERVAIQHVADKLELLGSRLPAPHSSAVRGDLGKGLRELRPRGGRSPWRPIYRQVGSKSFVILAVGPEYETNKRGFDRAVANAAARFAELEE